MAICGYGWCVWMCLDVFGDSVPLSSRQSLQDRIQFLPPKQLQRLLISGWSNGQ